MWKVVPSTVVNTHPGTKSWSTRTSWDLKWDTLVPGLSEGVHGLEHCPLIRGRGLDETIWYDEKVVNMIA